MKDETDPQQVLIKMYRYCAYRDRSYKETQAKLFFYELSTDEKTAIMDRLVSENYLDDQRFACAFSRGKFFINKWGKIKIAQRLATHGISKECIEKGLAEIDDEAYRKTLEAIIVKKSHFYPDKKSPLALLHYVEHRGYERELAREVIAQFFSKDNLAE